MSSEPFHLALAAIAATIDAERNDRAIDARCVSFVLQHGRKTERAIVLFHGFTNCPRQFAAFAELCFARGCNVYVPRLPRHGLVDKLTTQLAGLTADELAGCATAAMQIGAGLGETLTVVGLSAGATMVALLAQLYALRSAVAIAPFFSVMHVPSTLEPLLGGVLEHAPNAELWWDPRVKERAGPAHGYPRFSTHALAQCLALGQTVREQARKAAPRTVSSILVLNAKDPAIDNAAARDVWKLWREHGAASSEYVFENLDARHDIIEPTTYADAAKLVYPVLLDLLAL